MQFNIKNFSRYLCITLLLLSTMAMADMAELVPASTTPEKSIQLPIGFSLNVFAKINPAGAEYQSDAVVALHGLWNRKQPSGYKLVRVKFKDNKPTEVVDFATGWLQDKAAQARRCHHRARWRAICFR